jgi:DNA (cytosine-5)-methyltransferase 1
MALHTIEICAGVGMLGEGLRAGLIHLGIPLRTVCYVEREAYAAAVLAARCEEGSLDDAPVWSDLTTFNAGRWRGAVDGIAAGFPCQDLSLAGKRAGLDGKRSGLFYDILNIADDCGAWFLFLENVAGIASATAFVVDEAEGDLEERAAARVLGELADRGWHAEWLTISASDVGASHGRKRWFCFAWRMGNPDRQREQQPNHQDCAEPRRDPWPCAGGAGGELGNPDQQRAYRAGTCRQQDRGAEPSDAGGSMGNATRQRCGEARHGGTQAEHARLGGAIAALANASSTGQQVREHCRTCAGNRGGAQAHGPTEQLRRPFFAPGPQSPEWPAIINRHPELAPALEPTFRRELDGMAFAMDESRAQRLKCVGNGVVALCAAVAFVQLAKRSGLNTQ